MGWLFTYGIRRADLIAERTERRERVVELPTCSYRIVSRCIAHCYRGSAWRGVLWSVREHWWLNLEDGSEVLPPVRFIACDLLEYHRDGQRGDSWGYKDLCESSGPCEVSCPLSYLVMVPIEQYGGNARWRECVLEWHAQQRQRRRRRRNGGEDSEMATPTRLAQAAAASSRPAAGVA